MAEGTQVPAAAVKAAADNGHECADCDRVTEVELIYLQVTYSLPTLAEPGPKGKKPASPYAPGEVVDHYGHSAHLSRVRIYRSVVTPTELWGIDILGKTLEERSQKVQDAAKTKTPVESIIVGSPERKGAEMIYQAYCYNNDVGDGGADIAPGNEKYQLPTWEETPKRLSSGRGLFQYPDDPAFGRAPILIIYNKWGAGSSDTGVRFHSGREIRHRNTPGSARPAHLSTDRAGRWTELRATHGCLRVSNPDARDLYQTLRQYARLDFTYEAAPVAAPAKKKGAVATPAAPNESVDQRIKREGWEAATTRKGAVKNVAPNFMVGYLKAEGKRGWCAAREDGLDTTFAPIAKNMDQYKKSKSTPHVCDSMQWSDEQFREFYALTPQD